MIRPIASFAMLLGCLSCTVAFAAPVPVATWSFNGTLAAEEFGKPALTAIDPLGQSGFLADTVFGVSRTVYRFAGTQSPPEQAGLSVSMDGLLPAGNKYSVEMVFQFEASQSTWKNIFGVSNRTSDNAFYVEPGNKLQVWTAGDGPTNWTFGQYHHVTLTNDGTDHATAYLDGVFQFDLTTTTMNFSAYAAANPSRLITFFADNLIAGGQGEFSDGRVALIRLYDSELSGADILTLGNSPLPIPTIPEPETYAMMLAGLGLLGFAARRRKLEQAA